jgi:uncharacterized membrane protein
MASPSPWLHDVTALAFVLHVGAGTIALFAGLIAVFARKGDTVHRTAGNVFVGSMAVMAAFAIYLAVVMPDQLPNVFGGTFTLYLVVTAWLTVQREEGTTGWQEKLSLGVILILAAPFTILSFQLAAGMTPMVKSAVPFKGPVLIALYGFTIVTLIAVVADVRLAFAGGIAGAPRIARHLWRMCLGLTLAAGSAFTNGLPRLLPGPMRVTFWNFVPQLLVLALLVFWVIRVRFTGWYAAHRPSVEPPSAAPLPKQSTT